MWIFANDSTLYHLEALSSVTYLEKSAWSEWWNLYPNHKHIWAISLVYWITGIHEPISFEIINSLVWATSIITIYKSTELLFPENSITPLLISFFFFQPSVLISSTQLLRDPIFMLGFCLFFYGVVLIAKDISKWTGLVAIQVSMILILSMRDYLSPIFLIGILFFAIIILFRKKASILFVLSLAVPMLLYENVYENKYLFNPSESSLEAQSMIIINKSQEKVSQEQVSQEQVSQEQVSQEQVSQEQVSQENVSQENVSQEKVSQENVSQEKVSQEKVSQEKVSQEKVSQEKVSQEKVSQNEFIKKRLEIEKNSPSLISSELNKISRKVSTLRFGFRNVNKGAGSVIDNDNLFSSFGDILNYLPRAIQIGFLSPFPSQWFKEGVQVGLIGSILAGIETLFWYITLAGFFYLVFKKPLVVFPLFTIFLISISIILLIAYAVPNLGAIYRMRQPYMIPFYIFGIYGLTLLSNKFNKFE